MCVTGRDGTVRVELPVGKVVVALDRRRFEETWVGLDQEVEVTLEY